MKSIIVLNFLMFFSFVSFGQLRDTTIEIQNKKEDSSIIESQVTIPEYSRKLKFSRLELFTTAE